jgi:hypothetical protein
VLSQQRRRQYLGAIVRQVLENFGLLHPKRQIRLGPVTHIFVSAAVADELDHQRRRGSIEPG